MKVRTSLIFSTIGLLIAAGVVYADVPTQINFQGKVSVPRAEEEANEHGLNKGEKEHSKLFPFTGTGDFKFAIVDDAGNILWTNAPNSLTVPPPTEVRVPVKNGIFNVALGDTALGMPLITQAVFQGPNRFLRIFFRTEKQMSSIELLPPQKLLTVPFAFTSALAQSLLAGATVHVNTVITSSATITDLHVSDVLKVGDSIFSGRITQNVAFANGIAFTGGRGIIFNSATTPPPGTIPGGSSLDIEAAGGLFLNAVSTGMVFMSTQPISRVGIGLPDTTTPSEKLEVFGNVKSDFGIIASTGVFSSTLTAVSVMASSGAFSSQLTLAGSPVLTQAMLDGAAGLASTQAFSGQNTFLNQVAISSDLVVAGALNRTGNLSIGGPGFSVAFASAVTAGFFFGNGAGLSNLGAANLAGLVSAANGGTGANLSAASAGSLPFFSAASVMSALGPGAVGQILQSGGAGAPSWVSPSSVTAANASNLAGGAGGSLPYQSASNATAMLAPGSAGQILQSGGAGAPSWTSAPAFSGANLTNLPWAGLAGFPAACSAGNFVSAVGATLTCSAPGAGVSAANSGSGNGGAFVASANTTLAAGEYQFTNFTVNAGVTLTVDGFALIRVAGMATINGNIAVGFYMRGGQAPFPAGAGITGQGTGGGGGGADGGVDRGAGGGNGGAGGSGFAIFESRGGKAVTFRTQPFGSGGGSGAANAFTFGASGEAGDGGDGGGGLVIVAGGAISMGPVAITANGQDGGVAPAAGGGGSGGTIALFSGSNIAIAAGAALTANGGNSAGTSPDSGSGGGGYIILVAPSISDSSTKSVAAGTATSSAQAGQAGQIIRLTENPTFKAD